MESSMNITKEQLQQFFEDTHESIIDSFVDPLNKTFERFEINTPERVAMFLAQVGVESAGLTATKENLNYKAATLEKLWPSHFRNVDVNDYAHNPEKIANRVYCDRMGNGDEDSGDGYKYRGRGLIQLTGKDGYEHFAKAIGMDLDEVVDYLETPEGAAMSAGWFWDSHKLNHLADEDNVKEVTHKINGGYNGLEERESLYKEAREIFG